MTIDWKKYADQIYCLTYTGQTPNNYRRLKDELHRVDILDSGIYYEFENISTPIYEKIYKEIFHYDTYNYLYAVDCAFGHYYCMKHAAQHNYNRIIIIECDCIFLKDKTLIEFILEESLKILNDDNNGMFVLNAIDSIYPCNSLILPDAFSINITETKNLYGAAFNIYSKNARDTFIQKFENFEIVAPDKYNTIYDDGNINIYHNSVNICIQQNWPSYAVNSDILYNVDLENDLVNEYKDKKLELFNGFLCNYNDLQKLIKRIGIENVYFKQIEFLHKLFDYYNKYFFNNKLNIEDYKIDYDHT